MLIKGLLNKTGRSAQDSMITYIGEKRVDICICMADSLCFQPEVNTALQINYTPIIFFKRYVLKVELGRGNNQGSLS